MNFLFLYLQICRGTRSSFWITKFIPVLFDMKKINYFLASFFGLIPSIFIMNTIGAGLNSYVEQAENHLV